MPKTNEDTIDWSLTRWEGAKLEAMRHWRELPLAHIIASLEEMEELANTLNPPSKKASTSSGKTDTLKSE